MTDAASGSIPDRTSGRRRRLLGLVLVSIAVNAVLGIYALVVPHFGELQGKVLATSACVTGAGVLVFACLPALERRRLGLVPAAGIAASILGFALLIAGAWIRPDSPPFWKTAGTVLIVASVAVLVSILSLAQLAPRYRPVFLTTGLLAALFAAMIDRVLWSDGASASYGRVLGVVGVLLAATTIAVPILHRASRSEARPEIPSRARVRFCPSCGRRLPTAATAEGRCVVCGALFRVNFTSRPGHGPRRRRLPGRAAPVIGASRAERASPSRKK